jgi:hypothetical protein
VCGHVVQVADSIQVGLQVLRSLRQQQARGNAGVTRIIRDVVGERVTGYTVIIQGDALEVAIQTHANSLKELLMSAASCVCCRCVVLLYAAVLHRGPCGRYARASVVCMALEPTMLCGCVLC